MIGSPAARLPSTIATSGFTYAYVETFAADALESSQMYVYVGTKQSAGLDIEKAGLHNGSLFAVRIEQGAIRAHVHGVH